MCDSFNNEDPELSVDFDEATDDYLEAFADDMEDDLDCDNDYVEDDFEDYDDYDDYDD